MLIQLILPCRYGKVLQIIPEFFSACFFWQWNSSWWCGKHFHRTSFSVHSVCHWDIEPSVRMVKCAECSLTWSLFCLLPTCSSPTFLTALYWSLSLHFFIPKDHPISLSPTIFLLDSYLGKTCFFFYLLSSSHFRPPVCLTFLLFILFFPSTPSFYPFSEPSYHTSLEAYSVLARECSECGLKSSQVDVGNDVRILLAVISSHLITALFISKETHIWLFRETSKVTVIDFSWTWTEYGIVL